MFRLEILNEKEYSKNMKYTLTKDKIIIDKTDDFDTRAILECGQMFRFFKTDRGYKVITGHHIAEIIENDKTIEILTKSPKVFENFFDLQEDYGAIKRKLAAYPILKMAIEYGKGIRIARGEPEEVIFFFIISQNNNIKRIQKIIEKMSDIGEDIDGEYKAFPSAKTLANQPLEWFQGLGAGYRDVFLYGAAKLLAETNLDEIKKLSDDDLYNWLLDIKGIGPKVASCIMLFGFHRTSSFPVDTWIEKVYREYFYVGEMTRPQMSQYFQEKFGVMSGIVQQYLFYFQRSDSIGTKHRT